MSESMLLSTKNASSACVDSSASRSIDRAGRSRSDRARWPSSIGAPASTGVQAPIAMPIIADVGVGEMSSAIVPPSSRPSPLPM